MSITPNMVKAAFMILHASAGEFISRVQQGVRCRCNTCISCACTSLASRLKDLEHDMMKEQNSGT